MPCATFFFSSFLVSRRQFLVQRMVSSPLSRCVRLSDKKHNIRGLENATFEALSERYSAIDRRGPTLLPLLTFFCRWSASPGNKVEPIKPSERKENALECMLMELRWQTAPASALHFRCNINGTNCQQDHTEETISWHGPLRHGQAVAFLLPKHHCGHSPTSTHFFPILFIFSNNAVFKYRMFEK